MTNLEQPRSDDDATVWGSPLALAYPWLAGGVVLLLAGLMVALVYGH
jgi:hypothetical protein